MAPFLLGIEIDDLQLWHQVVFGDELAKLVHAVQELRQISMQACVQNFIDPAVLQIR